MNTIHVLHIDDDADFADVTASFIERVNSSVTVETAVSAEEGLDRLDDSIDCVVSDYEMPEIDGIELLESVRQEYPNLPFILFTGKGSEAVASEAISAGVTDYLQKTGSTEQYELLCKRIENAVTKRRAQTNYQELFQKVPAGLTMHDPDTGVIIDANLAFGELLGYEPDEFAGTHPGELSPNGSPFDRETANRLIQQTIETGQQQFEWQDQTKTGDIVWVMVITKQATIDGHQRVIAVVQDITEKKERERELERKEHIIQEMDDGVVVIQDQTITYANPAISEIISYPTEALLGDPMGKYIAPEYRETVRRRYEERLAGNDPPKTYEISLLANDGETVPVEITAARVRYGGEPATVSIVRDITERKQQIRTLERQNERLEEFASIVSHDLRNPLDVATTRLELAMDACDSPHLADIADAHDRMERLIDDLLVLARQGEQVREIGRCAQQVPEAHIEEHPRYRENYQRHEDEQIPAHPRTPVVPLPVLEASGCHYSTLRREIALIASPTMTTATIARRIVDAYWYWYLSNAARMTVPIPPAPTIPMIVLWRMLMSHR